MIKSIVLLCCLLASTITIAQPTLHSYATINSIGYQVVLPDNYDSDSNAVVIVQYRETGKQWQTAFAPTRLTIDSIRQFRGSLFLCKANTTYDIQVIITDSLPLYHQDILTQTITTRVEPNITPTQNLRYVSPNGTGVAYTSTNPGNIKTLLASGLSCGMTVIVKGGVYDVGDMTLTLNNDCSSGAPIIIMAAPGETPIFDGADHTQYKWTRAPGDTNIFYAAIKPELEYNALCLFDSLRLYPYGFLTPSSLDTSYPSLSSLGYEQSGFYHKANQVYIKTLDHRDPNNATITFSKYFSCLTVNGNNTKSNLYIKGITFKYYNKGAVDKDFFGNPTQGYPSSTIIFQNINQAVIDSCRFEFSNVPLSFNGLCNENIVQRCVIIDGTGYWSHGAFKQTRDQLYFEPGSYGRYLENSGIFFAPDATPLIYGNIVRNNSITGCVAGFGIRSAENARIVDLDISGNTVSHCYDGIDPTSACINTRVWNNTVSYGPVSFSLILPTYGPIYLFRNVAHHISERKNHHNDVFFAECDNTISNKIWGTGMKLNAGGTGAHPGHIYLMHNTFHSIDDLGFDMYLWFATWKKFYSRNNIYYSEGRSCLFFDAVGGDSTYSFDSQGDNFYDKRTGTIAIVQPVNGVAHCDEYKTVESLSHGLATITGSGNVMIQGYQYDPMFANPAANDFSLSDQSPLIDSGVVIDGLNTDFKNNAPDIGAFEHCLQAQLSDLKE